MELNREQDERRSRIAGIIEAHRHEIERRWLAAVTRTIPDCKVGETEIRDAMPDYLTHLSAALRGGEELHAAGEAGWLKIAKEHAVTRIRLGFDVDHLVREFSLLRRVMVQVVGEESHDDSHVMQDDPLTLLTEAAVAASVRSYVEARDYESRRMEAEHVGFITHELRNPLNTIRLGVSHLRDSVEPTARLDKVFSLIDRGIGRLGGLIDRVLTAERLEAGRVEAQPVDVEFGDLLDEALGAATAAAEAKQIDLDLTARDFADTVLHLDPKLALSALQNVIDNAVKFTDSGIIEVAGEDLGGRLIVHVRDNCGGLSAEELRTLFEPFKRGHTRKPGSGLGLAIARRAIEATGGSIHAESSGERGCVFSLTLPKASH